MSWPMRHGVRMVAADICHTDAIVGAMALTDAAARRPRA